MKKRLRRNTTIMFALMSAAGLAQAADPAWNGVYVGADGLWGIDGDSKWKLPADGGAGGSFSPQATGGSFSNSPKGSGWGIHVGENRQFGNLVVGVEGSWAWTDLHATSTNPFTGISSSARTSVKSLASLTPRVGYAFDNLMPYVKLGIALAEVEASLGSTSRAFSQKHLHDGWTAGVGVEYALPSDSMGSWVFGLEYNYYQFSARAYGGKAVPDNTWPVHYDVKPTVSSVMLRASYNFGARSRPGSGGSSGGTWEGLYAGVDAVWGIDGDSRWNFPGNGGAAGAFSPQATGGSFNQSPKGSGWGVRAGESRQFGNLVVGLEGAWAWTDLHATTSNRFTGIPSSAKTNIKSLASLTPKVGYAIGDWLPYAKAGLALAEVEASLSGINGYSPPVPVGSAIGFDRKHLHSGWTAGLGVEYVMPLAARNMVVGVEYNHYQFSGKTYGGHPAADNTWPVQFDLEPSVSTVTVHVSYKF
jgi:outer membrane immunogenic protein